MKVRCAMSRRDERQAMRRRDDKPIVRVLHNKAAAVSYSDDRCFRFMMLTLGGLFVADTHCFRPLDSVLGLASFASSSARLISCIASVTAKPSVNCLSCAGVARFRLSILHASGG